jgi:type I restriction enzyme S subunit
MTTWTKQKLGDVIEIYNGKAIKAEPKGVFPVYGSNGIIGYCPEGHYRNAIILGRVGAYCGSVMIEKSNFWASDNTIVVKNNNTADLGFIYYLLKNLNLNQYAGGAAQPLITHTLLRQINVSVPKLPTQIRIASVLSVYDDLIKNNEKRIKILEEMAQLLYAEWFVKFKFPGSSFANASADKHEKVKMINSELGKIPEGWEVKKILDICAIKYGKNLPTTNLSEDGKYSVYGAAKIIGKYNEYNQEKPTIITGCRGSVGKITITEPFSFITNNSFTFNFLEEEKFFFYYQLIERGLKDVISGSAQPQITIDNISSVKLFVPIKKLIHDFDVKIDTIRNLIYKLEMENKNLSQICDLLIPQLITGRRELK